MMMYVRGGDKPLSMHGTGRRKGAIPLKQRGEYWARRVQKTITPPEDLRLTSASQRLRSHY